MNTTIITTASSTELDAATNMSVLDDIIVFIPKLSFFDGQATLSADDLGIKAADISGDNFALGTKSIVDTDLLKYFKTTRKAIHRHAKKMDLLSWVVLLCRKTKRFSSSKK